jgi:NADH:ubiquinone oxidoreductase subunit C
MCLSGIDWDGYDENGKGKSVAILGYTDEGKPETSDRVAEGELGVAYHLYSHQHDHKFTLQVRLPRDRATVPTVSGVWPTASWHEREAWDLMGITFAGHPDPRRILMEESWVGHPLRKDYQMPGQWEEVPLEGQPYCENPFELDTPEDASPEPAGDEPAEG